MAAVERDNALMCGRYALYGPISRKRPQAAAEREADWFDALIEHVNADKPRFNVAPTQMCPVVRMDVDDVRIDTLRWGLVPFWAKDVKIGYKAINARAETIAEKPMFRAAFKQRRCLVPARGYFEWKGDAAPKQPYFIHSTESELILFAGLWETWRESDAADPLHSFTIVTGEPGIVSANIHDRQPVILPPAQWQAWLQGTVDDAKSVLSAAPEATLAYHPVPQAVGSPRNNRAELVEPMAAAN